MIPLECGIPVNDPKWDSWTPAEVTVRLDGLTVPWCVAGGWAIDLFRGEVTRWHEDLEVVAPASGFSQIRGALTELEFHAVGSGRAWPVDDPAFEYTHQTWGFDPRSGSYRLDIMREPHDQDTWICRRDDTIRRLYREVRERTEDGILYLAPEIVLLFKAKHARPKDEADYSGVLPLLDGRRRAWLRRSLERVHPGHHWLATL